MVIFTELKTAGINLLASTLVNSYYKLAALISTIWIPSSEVAEHPMVLVPIIGCFLGYFIIYY